MFNFPRPNNGSLYSQAADSQEERLTWSSRFYVFVGRSHKKSWRISEQLFGNDMRNNRLIERSIKCSIASEIFTQNIEMVSLIRWSIGQERV